MYIVSACIVVGRERLSAEDCWFYPRPVLLIAKHLLLIAPALVLPSPQTRTTVILIVLFLSTTVAAQITVVHLVI